MTYVDNATSSNFLSYNNDSKCIDSQLNLNNNQIFNESFEIANKINNL